MLVEEGHRGGGGPPRQLWQRELSAAEHAGGKPRTTTEAQFQIEAVRRIIDALEASAHATSRQLSAIAVKSMSARLSQVIAAILRSVELEQIGDAKVRRVVESALELRKKKDV